MQQLQFRFTLQPTILCNLSRTVCRTVRIERCTILPLIKIIPELVDGGSMTPGLASGYAHACMCPTKM